MVPGHRACQYPSSDASPQSSAPLHTYDIEMHRRLKQVNWPALHGATPHSTRSQWLTVTVTSPPCPISSTSIVHPIHSSQCSTTPKRLCLLLLIIKLTGNSHNNSPSSVLSLLLSSDNTIVLWPSYRSACVRPHSQLTTERICWSKVLLSAALADNN